MDAPSLSPVPVTVSIPPRAEFVHILRSVASGVGSRLGLSFDGIEDLRLAVDEACADLLAIVAPCTRLDMHLASTGDGLEAVVSTDAAAVSGWPRDGYERTLSWQILAGLTDEARPEVADGGPAIRIVKRAAGPPSGG